MHALQTPCASMLASNIGSGDGSFSTDFARSWDTDGPKWLNFERGVHRLSHSDSVLLARFVVSLDAWTPHLHDMKQLDALTQYLAGGLAAVLQAGLIHFDVGHHGFDGEAANTKREQLKGRILDFTRECARFTRGVHAWVAAGAHGQHALNFDAAHNIWQEIYFGSQIHGHQWTSFVPDWRHLHVNPFSSCEGILVFLREITTLANACLRWHELRPNVTWRRMVRQSQEIAAGRMLPSRQWANLFANGDFFNVPERAGATAAGLMMIFRVVRADDRSSTVGFCPCICLHNSMKDKFTAGGSWMSDRAKEFEDNYVSVSVMRVWMFDVFEALRNKVLAWHMRSHRALAAANPLRPTYELTGDGTLHEIIARAAFGTGDFSWLAVAWETW